MTAFIIVSVYLNFHEKATHSISRYNPLDAPSARMIPRYLAVIRNSRNVKREMDAIDIPAGNVSLPAL